MEPLKRMILPYLKMYAALAAAWLATANIDPATVSTFLAGQGLTLPDSVAAVAIGLVTAAAVWAVPNKTK